MTDAASNPKILVSDAAGRVTSVTEDPASLDPGGLNYQTTYVYDVLDNLTTVTQGAQTRSFGFDTRNNLTQASNPENGSTTYHYDANNNLISKTDNSGVAAGYGYDARNRITSVTYSGSARTAPNVAYYYDSGATNAKGRLVSVWNSAGTAQLISGYDALGRITGSSVEIGGTLYPTGYGSSPAFSYTYNRADALASITYPTGRVVTNTYDGANRLSSVGGAITSTLYAAGPSTTYFSNATYAAFGGIGSLNYAVTNGVAGGTRTFSYNGRLQLGEMHDQGSSLTDLKYYYGGAATSGMAGASSASNNGNPTGVVQTMQKGSGTTYGFTQTYAYDRVNRLSAAFDTGGWAQNFSFDRYGNPWTTVNFGLPSDRLPGSNVYTAANNQSGYTGTQYDAGVAIASGGVGNQTTMGASTLTFDAENRIVQAWNSTAHNSTCYGYDGLGERVYKQTFGTNTCTGTPATTATYVYDAFGNMKVQQETATAPATLPPTPCLTCYLTWDHLGSVRMVSDAVGAPYYGFTGFHDYAPFGEEVLSNAGRTADWGTIANGTDYLSRRYTGAERDTETTLDFLQARYLANQQARFVTPDPAGNFVADVTNPQSWNMYSYTANNPLAFLDPTGTCTVSGGYYVADGGDPCPGQPSFSVTVSANGGIPFCFYYMFLCSGGSGDGYGGSTAGGSGGGASGSGPSRAPSNGPTVSHCLGVAAADKGVSIGLDILGSIPAVGNAVSAGAGVVRAGIAVNHVITSPAFAVGSGIYGAYGGVTAGPEEATDSLVGSASAGAGIGLALADVSLAGTKAIPIVGNFVSVATLGWDGYQAYKKYQSCMAGH